MKIFPIFFLSCITFLTAAKIPVGEWRGAIQINDTLEVPFTFTSEEKRIIIRNGEEKIAVEDFMYVGDSVFIQMPVFNSEFRCKISDSSLKGKFINHARKENNIFSFHAEKGLAYRFSDRPEKTIQNANGKFRVHFDGEDDWAKDAVAIFEQDGNRVTGTFLTMTGDYRYLEGELNGNRLWLSTFNGFHVFLFTAIVKGDSIIHGEYFSGRHWHDTWKGKRDSSAHLADANKLIQFKAEPISFSYRDENGKLVSLSDFKVPVIIQIMGTWCPNCLDETKFLAEWYKRNSGKDVEIIALDYERNADSVHANFNIKRLKAKLDIGYPILFAGSSSDKKAIAKELGINRLLAFPTLLFLDKNKKIVNIHSGFSGPATGEEYEKFKDWFEKTVEKFY